MLSLSARRRDTCSSRMRSTSTTKLNIFFSYFISYFKGFPFVLISCLCHTLSGKVVACWLIMFSSAIIDEGVQLHIPLLLLCFVLPLCAMAIGHWPFLTSFRFPPLSSKWTLSTSKIHRRIFTASARHRGTKGRQCHKCIRPLLAHFELL